MSIASDYLFWAFSRRLRWKRVCRGFQAPALSYADSRCQFESAATLHKGAILYDTHLGYGSYTWARMARVKVGRFCSIGRAEIGGQGKHPTKWLSTHPAFYSAGRESGVTFASETVFDGEPDAVCVGNDVWIGHGAVVMEGCNIGDGAIVAAGSLVTKDVAPYAIVAGVPARALRSRFTDDVVELLLDWKWWNLPDASLRRIAPRFRETDNWSVEHIRELRRSTE